MLFLGVIVIYLVSCKTNWEIVNEIVYLKHYIINHVLLKKVQLIKKIKAIK